MKTAITTTKKPAVKAAPKKATKKPKPGTYAAVLHSMEIAKKTGVKYTWHK